MTKNSIKAIIWDLDGTLIHFKIDYIRARRVAIKILKEYGINQEHLTIKTSILDNIRTARDIFNSMGYTEKKINKIIKKINFKIEKIEREAAKIASMISGIDQVLEFAKNQNLKQAVYTLNSNKNARISLKQVELLQYFDLIVGRDKIKNIKPHPDHLLFICNHFNVDPDKIVVIGDSSRDIEGALNINAPSIALCTEFSKMTNLEIFLKANVIINENEIPLKLIEAIKSFL